MRISKLLVVSTLLLTLMFIRQEAKSQIVEVGAMAGASYYIGDINPAKHFNQSDFGFGASLRYYQSPRWAFRFQYSYLNLVASDKVADFRPERGLGFQNNVNDFSLIAEFNFFDYWTGSKRNFISPYIFAGISVFTFNPCYYDPDDDADKTPLQPLCTEGQAEPYSLVSWSIPFGIGMKYSLLRRVGLALEWRMHKTFTDYIDDVSGLYPDSDLVKGNYKYSDPTGNYEPGMQRGSSSGDHTLGYNNDWFGILNLTISYKFNLPKSKSCSAGISGRYF